ncbi:unnamed protein product [Dovyalis caffra]|uniref:Uncharacterized protein n=1 Tax=Dovyalis caffra TaxID=77055 RepID=A0AAV1RD19_9ROSI|nr:unnamed protein product [Dovyalis caffra]
MRTLIKSISGRAAMTAVWCFKVENLKSRRGFSRPEMMKRTSRNYRNLPFSLKRGAWSPEEDLKLIAYIKRYGIWNWNEMPKAAGLLRSGKSCRLRWMNYLRPDIKRGNFSKEEVQTIIKLHELLGNRWSAIAAKLPGRTDNDIKNYWNTHLRKHLINNINIAMRTTELQGTQKSNIEFKQKNPSERDISHPKILNSEEYSSKGWFPMSPKPFSASNPNFVNDEKKNKNQTIDEEIDVGLLESFGELSLWDKWPYSMEGSCKVEDDGETYTDEMWKETRGTGSNAMESRQQQKRQIFQIQVRKNRDFQRGV